MASPWFANLEEAELTVSSDGVRPLLTALSELPHLHTLTLHDVECAEIPGLGADRFIALGSLNIRSSAVDDLAAEYLTKWDSPRLRCFTAYNLDGAALTRLLTASCVPRLETLNLWGNTLGAAEIKELTSAPLSSLRSLNLGCCSDDPALLFEFTKKAAFLELTTLRWSIPQRGNERREGLVKALAGLTFPKLRHLDLADWRIGDRGAQALAANPNLLNLTVLNLDRADIGPQGCKALLESPYLQNLISLRLGNCEVGMGREALLDRGIMKKMVCFCTHEGPTPIVQRVRKARPEMSNY